MCLRKTRAEKVGELVITETILRGWSRNLEKQERMKSIKLNFLCLVVYCEKKKEEHCFIKPSGECAKNWASMGRQRKKRCWYRKKMKQGRRE